MKELRPFDKIYFTVASLLFTYVLVRAYCVGFTHDESISYTLAMSERGWSLTANNHWLNTLFGFIMGKLFGYSEISLRLPNVLAFGTYCYFVYKLLKDYVNSNLARYVAMGLLLFNYFILE